MTTLRTGFSASEQAELPAVAAPGRKVYRYVAESVMCEAERRARANLWYAMHPQERIMRCGDVWPPMPLRCSA